MLVRLLLLFCFGLFGVAFAYAEDSAVARQAAKVISYTDVLQWLFALIVVLAILGLVVWLLKKSGKLSLASKSQLAVLAGLSLGMREKLILVKVGEKQVLLGVTPGRVDKLLELEGDQRLFQSQDDETEIGLFAKKLQQVMLGKTNG